jgi:hypothetical protein
MNKKPDKPPKMTLAQQSAAFKKTAKELEADESGEAFDRVLSIIKTPAKAAPIKSKT